MGGAGGRTVRWLGFAVATALLAVSAVLWNPPPASAAGEGTILALVNQSRAQNGLGALTLNASISAVSAAWANQMAANGVMQHNPDYASQVPAGWSRVAENVAQGYPSPEAVHSAWMGSAGHRANILGDFTDIGIAFITANGTTWAVENFAKYGASVVPPPPPPAPPAAPAPAPPASPPAAGQPEAPAAPDPVMSAPPGEVTGEPATPGDSRARKAPRLSEAGWADDRATADEPSSTAAPIARTAGDAGPSPAPVVIALVAALLLAGGIAAPRLTRRRRREESSEKAIT